MDGKWNSSIEVETTQQGELSRHRLLRVNLSTIGTSAAGDASSNAASDPNTVFTDESGPHFILSPITPDNSKTYGFEFALFSIGAVPAVALAPGFNVTIWALVGTRIFTDQTFLGAVNWAAFQTINSVNFRELYHSFDINASAIRFQISNSTDDINGGSVMIAMSEL